MGEGLTAADLRPPALQRVAGLEVAGFDVSLQELAVTEAVHGRICAQSVDAGADEGIWVGEVVAGGEGRLIQEFTAVEGDRTIVFNNVSDQVKECCHSHVLYRHRTRVVSADLTLSLRLYLMYINNWEHKVKYKYFGLF